MTVHVLILIIAMEYNRHRFDFGLKKEKKIHNLTMGS